MHRLFAALSISDEIAERLLSLRAQIPGLHWRAREHFHITLHFFGAVDTQMAEEIALSLEQARAPAMSLSLSGVGWFGRKEPRALYARVVETESLTALAKQCHNIARRLGAAYRSKPFIPHITLAYCHQAPLEHVRRWSEDCQSVRSGLFYPEQFHLYESFTATGHRKKSRYEKRADYWLG